MVAPFPGGCDCEISMTCGIWVNRSLMRGELSKECHTRGIRNALTLPKDCVSVPTLGSSTFCVSKSAVSFNSRNHFIEFDRKGSRPYFVSHLTVQFLQVATAEDADRWNEFHEAIIEAQPEEHVLFVIKQILRPAREKSSICERRALTKDR